MGYGTYRPHYVRTLDKKEIDFVIARNNVPVLAVEVKTSDLTLSNSLKNRATWFPTTPILSIQVIDRRDVLRKYSENTWLMSIERFLALLV